MYLYTLCEISLLPVTLYLPHEHNRFLQREIGQFTKIPSEACRQAKNGRFLNQI